MKTSLGSVPVLYRRETVSAEDFSSYWRDIHGVFVAAFLGPSRYRMLHFEQYDPTVWASDLVSRDLPSERVLGGIAEFVFSDESQRHNWLNTVGGFADADDAVVFRRSTSYSVSENGFYSLKELLDQPDVDETSDRLFVMLKAKHTGEGFRQFVSEEFGGALADATEVLHVQATFYEPYHTPTREFLGGAEVERFLKPDEQHQATLEIIFKDVVSRSQFFEWTFPSISRSFSEQVMQVHAYRVKGAYTHIRNSQLTLTGWLGSSRATLARRVNATNIIENLDRANRWRHENAPRAGEGWKRVTP